MKRLLAKIMQKLRFRHLLEHFQSENALEQINLEIIYPN